MASLGVFWKKGYFDASIEDLTRATGVSRSGLYGEFRSKRGIFLATIDFYESQIVDRIMGRLEGSGEGIAGIERAFADVMQAARNGGRLGCLVCNASSEAASMDGELRTKVTDFHDRVRGAFLGALGIAEGKGELPGGSDVGALADYLLGAFQGLAHAIRSPMPIEAVGNFAAISLMPLRRGNRPT